MRGTGASRPLAPRSWPTYGTASASNGHHRTVLSANSTDHSSLRPTTRRVSLPQASANGTSSAPFRIVAMVASPATPGTTLCQVVTVEPDVVGADSYAVHP